MMLHSIDIVQFENEPLEWRLEGLTLAQINLVVGRNACGKSKALGAIRDLAGLVSGARKPQKRKGNVSFAAQLQNGSADGSIAYELKIIDRRVVKENLRVGGTSRITRGAGGVGKIYFDKLSQDLDFQSPEDELACVNRRDSIQHPYIDALHEWGHASFHYSFNSLDLGKHHIIAIAVAEVSDGQQPTQDELDQGYSSNWPVQFVYKAGTDKFGERFKTSLLDDMRKLDYLISDVAIQEYDNVPKKIREKQEGDFICLNVGEEGLSRAITQFEMSDGMFRALSILIHVTYAALSGKPSCVIIDDIGEGLDYERSCILIKLLIEKAQQTGIQLVMATNDRFVMNNVPLEYWTILSRERTAGSTRVKVYNYRTHKAVFDEFAYTGLNNFDFFATRFFEENLDERT
jgi:energy-coupling factor transporter ATP-binding protein EcfA2